MPDNKRITLPKMTDVAWYELPEEVAEPQEAAPDNTQQAALMVMRAAIIETTASRGWLYVERFAETVVRDLEAKALAEDDDEKSNGLRRDARGARKFKDDLFTRLLMARSYDPKDNFVEVVTD